MDERTLLAQNMIIAIADSNLLNWLLRLPAVKGQAFFWNYSSRTERRKAMMREMKKELDNAN